MNNKKCKLNYKKYSDYKGNDENIWNYNIPEERYKYKCVYKNGQCTEEERSSCSEFIKGQYVEYCENIKFNDEKRACELMSGGECKEIKRPYCEFYEGTNENECKSIIPKYENNDYSYKCIFKEGKCQGEKRSSCDDYFEGEDSRICTETYYIRLNDENKYCRFINNKCVEYYKQCSNYEGSDESICNSIITENGGKCEYKNNACVDKTLSCSDYTSILDIIGGESCEQIYPSNNYKRCVYSDYNCKEKDLYCLDFSFYTIKEICENAPTSSSGKKCVLADDKSICIEKDKNDEIDENDDATIIKT